MSGIDLDGVLLAARPISDEELAGFDFELAELELLNQITARSLPEASRRWRPGRRLALGLALVGACIAALSLIPVLNLDGGSGERSSSAFAAEAVEIAEANRRLLITEPGWSVAWVDWNSEQSGSTTFATGGLNEAGGVDGDIIDINWYPADEKPSRYVDLSDRERVVEVLIDGETVPVQFENPKNTSNRYREFRAILKPEDGTVVVIDGGVTGDRSDVERVLESTHSVDTYTWLSAMPKTVVQPAEQDGEIAGLLEGVPLPPDFDRSTVEPAKLPQDRYQLTYFVMSGVYCSWLDRWWFAHKAGDDATAAEAIDMLLASPRWPAVAKASKTGSIGDDFRDYAKTVADGYGDKKVYDQMMNCIEY